MSFVLSSSVWPERLRSRGERPEEGCERLSPARVREAVASLQTDLSVDFHPRAELEDVDSGRRLVVYRSGRVEWCPQCSYRGYDPAAAWAWLPEDRAVQLCLALLQGDTVTIRREAWRRGHVPHCPVCGYDLGFPPWGATGDAPGYAICDCCGTEFGADDRGWGDAVFLRRHWLATGCRWFTPDRRPAGWSPERQLRNVPTDLMRSWPCDEDA